MEGRGVSHRRLRVRARALIASLVVAATMAGVSGATTGRVWADPPSTDQGSVDPTQNGALVTAVSGSDSPGGAAGGGAPATSGGCTWTAIPSTDASGQTIGGTSLPSGPDGPGVPIAPGTPGTWYLGQCTSSPNADFTLFVPAGQAIEALVSPQQLLQEAQRELVLPAPQIALSPPVGQWQYVNVPTWLWVPAAQWVPVTATASAGTVTVTATATPVGVSASYEDFTGPVTATCAGPGTPYVEALADQLDPADPLEAASPDCGWTWRSSSAGRPGETSAVGVHVVYDLTWTVTGAAGGGDLGARNGPDALTPVAVAEIQALGQ